MKIEELSKFSSDVGFVEGVLRGIELTANLNIHQKKAIMDAQTAMKRIYELGTGRDDEDDSIAPPLPAPTA